MGRDSDVAGSERHFVRRIVQEILGQGHVLRGHPFDMKRDVLVFGSMGLVVPQNEQWASSLLSRVHHQVPFPSSINISWTCRSIWLSAF